MNINLDEVKLLLGGYVLDIYARDKVIMDLTNKLNALESSVTKVREFPKEVENADVQSVVESGN